MRAWVVFSAVATALTGVGPVLAQDPDPLDEPGGPSIPAEEPPEAVTTLRNPQGAMVVQGIAGVATGSGGTAVIVGAGVGYAVVTGVVPGIRGLLLFGDAFGAELGGTLTLTPPLEGSITPFAVGEIGHRWESELKGPLYGVGGGLYLGDPRGNFSLQLGAVYRIWVTPLGTAKGLSPVFGVSVRF